MKRALLVGINNYKKVNDLNGCINDVTNIRSILKTYYDYTNSGIRVLIDNRAGRDEILMRLKAIISESKSGDEVFFSFSGHGSQVRDRNGDELKDRLDEIICCWNMDWDKKTYIIDDELGSIINGVKSGVKISVLLDCCFSGTGIKSVENVTYRYNLPPLDILCRHEGEEHLLIPKVPLRKIIKQNIKKKGSEIVFWAGCAEGQYAADAYIKKDYNGAFTYYWCKTIRDSNAKLSDAQLISRVRSSLKYGGFNQTPQLESTLL
jgi:hypothetical protein